MPNTILYHTTNSDEVLGVAYSLLKYLGVYNLKPPSDQELRIYTADPASLELYGSLFEHYELLPAGSKTTMEIIREVAAARGGNLLYLGPNSYPAKPLEPVFQSIQNGTLYAGFESQVGQAPTATGISLLGFNSQLTPSIDLRKLTVNIPSNCIVQYGHVKEFNFLLRYFFKRYQEESVPNQVKLIHHIDALEIIRQRDAFNQLPFYVRWIRQALGRGWRISSYMRRI